LVALAKLESIEEIGSSAMKLVYHFFGVLFLTGRCGDRPRPRPPHSTRLKGEPPTGSPALREA
jgi:hypothetical protein